MDDLIKFVLDEVALDGETGTSLARFWQYVQQFFDNQSIAQTIDRQYKRYIWSFFIRDNHFKTNGNYATNDLAVVETVENFKIVTSDEKQWIALTGQRKDPKKLPPKVFSILSAVSTYRDRGINQVELCKIVGQDARSLPGRTSVLVNLGLIVKLPIITRGSTTSLLMLTRFYDGDACKARLITSKEITKPAEVNINAVRIKVTEVLSMAKNNVLRMIDLGNAVHMNMSTWEKRRFATIIRKMEQSGYVRRIRVPGVQTKSFMKCVQLSKPYDGGMMLKEEDIGNEINELDSDLEEDDCEPNIVSANDEIDTSMIDKLIPDTAFVEPIVREHTLEYQIYCLIAQSGTNGMSGPDLRSKLQCGRWLRILDEFLKKIAPKLEDCVQPAHLSSLGLGFEGEYIGKVFQYRFFTREAHRAYLKRHDIEKQIACVDLVADGNFPSIDAKLLVAHPGVASLRTNGLNRGRPRKFPIGYNHRLKRVLTEEEIVAKSTVVPRKRGRPPKDLESTGQRKRGRLPKDPDALSKCKIVTLETLPCTTAVVTDLTLNEGAMPSVAVAATYNSPPVKPLAASLDKSTVPNVFSISKDLDQKVIVPNLASVDRNEACEAHIHQKQSVSQPFAALNTLQIQEIRDISESGDLTSLHRPLCANKPRRVEADRRREGRLVADGTSSNRNTALLEVLEKNGGIVEVNPALLKQYNEALQTNTGITQNADRRTMLRTIQSMVAAKKVNYFTIAVENWKEVVSNKFLLSRREFQYGSDEVTKAVRCLKSQAKVKPAPSPAGPIPEQARVEMDIYRPLKMSLKDKVGGVKLTAEQMKLARVRLSAKDSIAQDDVVINKRQSRNNSYWKDVKHPRTTRTSASQTKPQPSRPKPRLSKAQNIAASMTGLGEQGQTTTYKPRNRRVVDSKAAAPRGSDRLERSDQGEDDEYVSRSVTKRLAYHFDEHEDDLLIRAVALSQAFYGTGKAAQLSIKWSLVQALLPHRAIPVLRRRYASARNQQRLKVIGDYIVRGAWVYHYNKGVHEGKLAPFPSDPAQASLAPYVDYSYNFDPAGKYEESAVSLPSTIEEFCQQLEVSPVRLSAPHVRDILFSPHSSTVRAEAAAGNAYVNEPTLLYRETESDYLEAVVKSTLMTKQDVYDAEQAKAQVLRYGTNDDVATVIQRMVNKCLIVPIKGETSRVVPGRNYQFSEVFFKHLVPLIKERTFRQAHAFGQLLMTGFGETKKVLFPELANNGAVACTVEKIVLDRTKSEITGQKFRAAGLTDGYRTKQIGTVSHQIGFVTYVLERTLLDFQVILSQNLTEPTQPLSDASTNESKFPLPCMWMDIHGHLLGGVYSQVNAIVLSHILMRGVCSYVSGEGMKPVLMA